MERPENEPLEHPIGPVKRPTVMMAAQLLITWLSVVSNGDSGTDPQKHLTDSSEDSTTSLSL